MTIKQKVDLCDMLGMTSSTLEKARFMMQELLDDYFNKYDSDENDEYLAIIYDFRRMKAFANIVDDLLREIEATLPTSRWVEKFRVDEGA